MGGAGGRFIRDEEEGARGGRAPSALENLFRAEGRPLKESARRGGGVEEGGEGEGRGERRGKEEGGKGERKGEGRGRKRGGRERG